MKSIFLIFPLQVHQRSKIVLSLGKIAPEKTPTLHNDNSTKSRYLSTPPKRKIRQNQQTPQMILPKPEIIESETSPSAKRRRKPVSKFDDFVLDNSTKKLISASDLRKSCSKDEIRLIQLHFTWPYHNLVFN